MPDIFDPTSTSGGCLVPGCWFPHNVWDGTHALTNGGFSNVPDASESNRFDFRFAGITEFTFDTGMSAVGIGLSNFQSLGGPAALTNHTFFVNGIDMGLVEDLVGWSPGIDVRNSYVLITASGGDVISSIAFQNDQQVGRPRI